MTSKNFSTKKTRLAFNRIFFVSILSAVALLSLGCETDDDNKLAKAQECLDKVDDANIAAAQSCASIVDGLTSPESYVIRCSVGFIVGGVTSADITGAFDAYNAAPANLKAATLMGALAHGTDGEAATTAAACKASEVPSLDYLATLSQVGTAMIVGGGSSTPATFLTNCAAGSCNDTVVGNAIISMYDVYCIGEAATNPACTDIGSAIDAGGAPAAIAQALYDLLQ